MPFGQLVIGPPGSGKTTYCFGISQFYKATERPVIIVNLDPANDGLPFTADVDISELVKLEEVMLEFGLGPNGGMVYCIEYLEANFDWLLDRLAPHKDKYFLFDCPGQVELFTHNNALRNIIDRLTKALDFRLCSLHFVDAHYCVDPPKYVAMLLLSLKAMIQLGLPHVNVLSKIDLVESYGKLAFSLDYYAQVQDLSYLLEHLNSDPFSQKYVRLNEALCDLVQEFGLVSFATLCVEDRESVLRLARTIDKANGYIYGGLEQGNESLFSTAERWDAWERTELRDVSERYIHNDADDDHDVNIEDIAGRSSLLGEVQERNTHD